MRYEYETVTFDTTTFWNTGVLDHETFRRELNRFGEKGWELINVLEMHRGYGATHEVIAIFKREAR